MNLAGIGYHARDAPMLAANGGDPDLLDDADAAAARATGECLGRVHRVRLPILRQKHRSNQVIRRKQRPALLGGAGRQHLYLEAEAARHGCAALELFQPRGARGNCDRADLPEAGRLSRLALESLVQLRRVLRQTREVLRRAQLPDQARGMPGRAAGEPLALEQQHVAAAAFGEMIGNTAADDAAADDHVARVRRNVWHGSLSFRPLRACARVAA